MSFDIFLYLAVICNVIVCVQGRQLTSFIISFVGGKKSLENVFARQTCHPKMAMVIDDRIKVWEKEDQSRVHVVAPFAPYFAPQAEVCSAL